MGVREAGGVLSKQSSSNSREGRGHSHVPPRVSRLGRKVCVLGRGSLSSGSLHGRKVGRVSAIGEVGRETWRAWSTEARGLVGEGGTGRGRKDVAGDNFRELVSN